MSVHSYCCTSVIISGKARHDGRPVMMKHRDTEDPNNRMEWFMGPKYSFKALVNSTFDGRSVWAGMNSAGFCIINTATYDLKDDDVPYSEMDQEGVLMFNALGICESVEDFQNYLDTLTKPWHVEANFGVIDAFGGAAYFEANNHEYVRFNVADEPGGYMVVTNFTRTGRKDDRLGVDRWEKACDIMEGIDVSHAGHKVLFNEISRSYLPILRDISACSIVMEGVPSGSDPSETVMWTICGCPSNCIYVPLRNTGRDDIPAFMKSSLGSENAEICDIALRYKSSFGLEPGCVNNCRLIENKLDRGFDASIGNKKYSRITRKAFKAFKNISASRKY